VTAALWAAIFRAPLASFCSLDMSLWIEGATGSLKSTVVAVFLSHFGDFTRTTLPGAWSSTANQLERRAFILKDTVFVIDDYAPTGLDAREMETKAARIIRSQGNLAGRGRLRSDLSERPAYPPRGLIISTGEQHPPGQSLLARTLIMELERAKVNTALLSEAQRAVHLFRHAMAGYISWLGPQADGLQAALRSRVEEIRRQATEKDGHLRVPEAIANLELGLHYGLEYAKYIGACSAAEAETYHNQAWEAFMSLGRAQGRLVEGERPTRRFLTILHTLITQDRAFMVPKGSSKGDDRHDTFLGWFDDQSLYIIPDAAFQAVVRFCREQEEPSPIRQERLRSDLAREKLIESNEKHRHTVVFRVGKRLLRVLRFGRHACERLIDTEFPYPGPGLNQTQP